VLEGTFVTKNGEKDFTVEFVDSQVFEKLDPRVDFDVNNLKVERFSLTQARLGIKYANQRGASSVVAICCNIRVKTLLVIKPISEVTQRIQKMSGRGWKVSTSRAGAADLSSALDASATDAASRGAEHSKFTEAAAERQAAAAQTKSKVARRASVVVREKAANKCPARTQHFVHSNKAYTCS
jgi:hypothetical protein